MTNFIQNKTHFFDSYDKTRKLFYQSFENTEKKSKGLVLITHGHGEHSDAYRHLANFICQENNMDVLAWDMVGHGRSTGQRGYVGDIHWLTEDLKSIFEIALKQNEGQPIFSISHSLGALVQIFLESNKEIPQTSIKGSIFSNPCLALNFTPPKWKTVAADMLTKIAPRITLSNELFPEQLSSDPDYLEEFKSDALRHASISPRLYLGMLSLMDRLPVRLSLIHI